ncbi:MAG: hypothetical protein KDA84_21840, partial [Planctomycetaceae bacterium]|nr:hypothetical protein [Planctomycetaceae bacterium]
RFVYDGDPPRRELLELNKDIAYCGKFQLRDEELIVNRKTRGLKNVVLWLEPMSADDPLPVHSSYNKSADAKIQFDNAECRFEPHICVLRTTQTLVIGNKDKINHNVAAFFFKNDPFNENAPIGGTVEKQLPKSERLPAKVTCPIHAWMQGYIILKDHPYVAVTDDNGEFELKNLPVGEWTLRVWHEKPGYIKEVTLKTGPQKWELGRASITIQPGDNTWGDVKLAPEIFEK